MKKKRGSFSAPIGSACGWAVPAALTWLPRHHGTTSCVCCTSTLSRKEGSIGWWCSTGVPPSDRRWQPLMSLAVLLLARWTTSCACARDGAARSCRGAPATKMRWRRHEPWRATPAIVCHALQGTQGGDGGVFSGPAAIHCRSIQIHPRAGLSWRRRHRHGAAAVTTSTLGCSGDDDDTMEGDPLFVGSKLLGRRRHRRHGAAAATTTTSTRGCGGDDADDLYAWHILYICINYLYQICMIDCIHNMYVL